MSKSSPAGRRTQGERTAQTRAALITSARRLFGAEGFAEVGAERIAREAGMTRGALYHQFADKADLFAAVLDEVEAEIAQRVGGAGQEHAGGVGRVQGGHGADDSLGDLGFDLVEYGGEQVRLVGELMVEGTAGHARLTGDALSAHLGEALGTEQPPGRGDQRGPGLRRPLALGPAAGRAAL